MKSIQGTQTEANVVTAFLGESAARNRYNFYSAQAKKDGYVELSAFLTEVEDHERAHAKRLYKFLEGGSVEVTLSLEAEQIGSTIENLKNAIAGEQYEYETMYPDFAKVARDEGFETIAVVFEAIASAERYHANTFTQFLRRIENDSTFKRSESVKWRCRKCGYIYTGTEPPPVCPACAHPQGYFEVLKNTSDN
ncbi:rubrerythrin family protein [candidate division KSB1 bacterium]|nr:rubrerythrin family protein [candidate division KSB1 bacterium]